METRGAKKRKLESKGENGMEWLLKGVKYCAEIPCGRVNTPSTRYKRENLEKALEYYEKAAALGNGCAYIQCIIIRHDDTSLVWRRGEKRTIEKFTDSYTRWFCVDNGLSNEHGSMAEKYLKQSVDEGNPIAMCQYANNYIHYTDEKWPTLISNAAALGHLRAMHLLGCFYGDTAKRLQITTAWRWFKKAAALGYTSSEKILEDDLLFFRTCELHENTRFAIYTLICIRKYQTNKTILNLFPLDIVILITKCLWKTRDNPRWEFRIV